MEEDFTAEKDDVLPEEDWIEVDEPQRKPDEKSEEGFDGDMGDAEMSIPSSEDMAYPEPCYYGEYGY